MPATGAVVPAWRLDRAGRAPAKAARGTKARGQRIQHERLESAVPLAGEANAGHFAPVLSPKILAALTRAFVRDSRMRRTLMFYIALAASLMVFIGSVLLDAWLRSHPLLFVGYWAVCAWFTLAAALLAVFDLLVVRASARAAQREIQRNLIPNEDDPHPR